MAIVTIQHRRGNYDDFDKQKMLPGEMAWVLADDPNLPSGKAVYVAFKAGDVERLVSVEQLEIMIREDDFKGDPGDKGDKGDKGNPGKDGISVTGADINDEGHLIIYTDDGKQHDAGFIDDALARLDEAKQAAASAEESKTAAAASAQSAQEAAQTIGDSVERSETAASQAAESASQASASQTAAASSAESAEQAKTDAQTAASEAEESATSAETSASQAETSASSAESSATSASQSKESASESATSAAASASAAEESAKNAKTSETNADQSAKDAAASAEKASEIAGGDFVLNSDKGEPNGVASLGEDGKVPLDQLPDIAPHTVSTRATLKATKWAGEEPPYTYTLNIDGLRADQHVSVYNADDLTNEQIRGFSESCITWKSQAEGQIVLKSLQKPALDLPIILELEEGQEEIHTLGNCTDISATAGDGTVTIKWTDPVDDEDAVWVGTKLVRKEGGYPESPEDGTELVDSKERDAYKESGYEDSGVINGTTYYYQLFPYTDKVVTNDPANRAEATPKGFGDLTWAEIDAAVTDGSYKTRFKLHDTKDLVLGGDYAETIPVEIAGFDHDDLADGSGKAGITFAAKFLPKDSQQMNGTSTNDDGWERCALRTLLNGAILDAFPDDLKPLVKSVKKVSDGGYSNQTEVTTWDKVWIPSYHEVGFSGDKYVVGQQGTQYDIFTDNGSRKRSKKDASSSTFWWLRSSYVSGGYYFWSVSSGGFRSEFANSIAKYGVEIFFCLGKAPE